MKFVLLFFLLFSSLLGFSQKVIWSGEINVSVNTYPNQDYRPHVVSGKLYFYNHNHNYDGLKIVRMIDVKDSVAIEVELNLETNLSDVLPVDIDDDISIEFLVKDSERRFYLFDHDGALIMETHFTSMNLWSSSERKVYYETKYGNYLVLSSEGHTDVISAGEPVVTSSETSSVKKVNNFLIYPNPSESEITITGKTGEEVLVYDIYGNKMDSFILKGSSIKYSVSNLNRGAYIFIKGDKSVKFVKQ